MAERLCSVGLELTQVRGSNPGQQKRFYICPSDASLLLFIGQFSFFLSGFQLNYSYTNTRPTLNLPTLCPSGVGTGFYTIAYILLGLILVGEQIPYLVQNKMSQPALIYTWRTSKAYHSAVTIN